MKNKRVEISTNDSISSLKIYALKNRGLMFIIIIWIILISFIFSPFNLLGNLEQTSDKLVTSRLEFLIFTFFLILGLTFFVWNSYYTFEIVSGKTHLQALYFIHKFNLKSFVLEKNTKLFLAVPQFQKMLNLDFDSFGIGEWSLYALSGDKKIKLISRLKKDELPIIEEWIKSIHADKS